MCLGKNTHEKTFSFLVILLFTTSDINFRHLGGFSNHLDGSKIMP